MKYNQKSFGAGLNLLVDDSQIPIGGVLTPSGNITDGGYVWTFNTRNRFNRIEPNKKHIELVIPDGKLQGGISLGEFLIIFVDGKAWVKSNLIDLFTPIPDLNMDAGVDIIYSCLVPASSFGFVRKLATDLSIFSPILAGTDFKINGTPQAVVVQDGINQPWLIIYDSVNNIFTTRMCGSYATWDDVAADGHDREYVPIGLQMFMMNQVLFMVAPDRKSLYRSITGRPLDFMINVNGNGEKAASESIGGAASVSQAFDFDEITCVVPLDIADSFIWGTRKNSRIVTADYTKTIFGEPTFRTAALLNVGVINQFSFSDALNDYVSIDSSGIKSFNAVQQLKFKGNNSIFSLLISRLLYNPKTKKRIKQVNCSVVGFNDYLLFNLDTFYGNIICVYDKLKDTWVSLDITEITNVKQFIVVDTAEEDKLYALTEDNRCFQMYASTEAEKAQLRVRAFIPENSVTEHKAQYIRPVFNGGTYNGQVSVREFVDDQESINNYTVKDLKVKPGGIPFPMLFPIMPCSEQRVENPSFPLTSGLVGKKLAFIIQWTNDADLIEIQVETSEEEGGNSQLEKNRTTQDTYGPTSND